MAVMSRSILACSVTSVTGGATNEDRFQDGERVARTSPPGRKRRTRHAPTNVAAALAPPNGTQEMGSPLDPRRISQRNSAAGEATLASSPSPGVCQTRAQKCQR